MNLWQAFKMAFKSISMKKTRSFLTMLGIIIGVASVVIMVSVVQGQNRQTMEMFEKMGDNKITVRAYNYYDTNNETSQKLYDYCLTLSDLVDGITPDVELNDKATVQYGAKTLLVNDYNGNYDWEKAMHIKLGSDQYGVCNNYTLAGGREMSYLDVEKTNAVCVLGAGAKEALFDFTDPVGEYITINGQPFKVVGYYNSMDIEYWPEMDNIIVLPYTFNRSMNNNSSIDSYVVKAKSAQATVEAMTLLTAYLSGMFPQNEMGYCDFGGYNVNSDNSSAEQIQSQSNMQSLVLGAIAGISLLVGVVATGVSLVIGVAYGLVSGYAGGRLDALMMRLVDVLFALPFIVLVIIFSLSVEEPARRLTQWVSGMTGWSVEMVSPMTGLIPLFIAIGALGWLTLARIVRTQTMELKGQEFVEAARSLGIGHMKILFRHIAPNLFGAVIVYTTLAVPGIMLLEAVLSFLGLGVKAPNSSWGTLIKEGADRMEVSPELLLFPALLFSATLLALNFLGDGLRDALDPKSSRD